MAAVPVIQCRHEFTLASKSGHSANKSHKIRQRADSRKNTRHSIGAQLRPSVWSSFVHSDTVQRKTAKWECKPFVGEIKLPSDRIQSFLVRCTHIMPGIQASVQRMYRRHHTPAGSPDDPPLSAPLIDRSSSVANGEKRGTKKMERIKYS